jgi:hypothetical protein
MDCRRIGTIPVICAVLVIPSLSLAATLPSAFAYVEAGNLHDGGLPPQSLTWQSAVGDPLGGATGSAGFFGVSATAFGYAGSQGEETYYFRVNGPTTSSLVPLSVSSTFAAVIENGDCGSHGCQHGSATATISYDGSALARRVSDPSENIDNFPPSLKIVPGDVHNVGLDADVISLDSGGNFGTFGQANASMVVRIDPLWLASNPGYTLEFSDGVDPPPLDTPSAAPISSALPMFAAGLLMLGAAGWHRRKAATRLPSRVSGRSPRSHRR